MSELGIVRLRRVDRVERGDLYDLVDEYLQELSVHREHAVGPTHSANYTYLPLYWEEASRQPFFILAGNVRIGFVLVREVEPEGIIEMSDFYIRPQSRRAGAGRAALAEVWHRFPGMWRLQVHPLNLAASAFWPRMIEGFATGSITSREVVEDDGRRREYSFEIPSVDT